MFNNFGSSKKGNKGSLSNKLLDRDSAAADNTQTEGDDEYEYDVENDDTFGNKSPMKKGGVGGEDVIQAPKGRLSFKKKNEPKYDSRLTKVNNKKVSFDIPTEGVATKASYYNQDILVAPKYDKLNEIGETQVVGTNTIVNGSKVTVVDLEDKPKDNPEARASRVREFEEAANRRVSPASDFDNFDDCLLPGEKVVCSLKCSLISGLPSTTDDFVISGSIKVSLVTSTATNGGYRLLFSVADGWKEISVFEEFMEMETIGSCVCCFYNIEKDKAVLSTSNLKYSTKRTFNTQFATLPVKMCVVDSTCYRSTADEFYALSKSEAQAESGGIFACCLNCYASCMECCAKGECCKCCQGESSNSVCCGPITSKDTKIIKFEASQSKNLNEEEEAFPPIIGQATSDVDGISWKVSSSNQDYVYVLIHYRSLLDMSYRTCKFRVSQTESPAESFKVAKKFVSTICSEKSQYDSSFFDKSNLSLKLGPYQRVMFRGEENLTPEGLELARREQELAFSGGNVFLYKTLKYFECCYPSSCIKCCGDCCRPCSSCCPCCCPSNKHEKK